MVMEIRTVVFRGGGAGRGVRFDCNRTTSKIGGDKLFLLLVVFAHTDTFMKLIQLNTSFVHFIIC